MANQLNILFSADSIIEVGELSRKISALLGLETHGNIILLGADRIKYMEKHRDDFSTEHEFRQAVLQIPNIVMNPDFVGLHPKGHSIQFIKQLRGNVLVAVRVSDKDNLWVRTMYPISDQKLNNYIASGRVMATKT